MGSKKNTHGELQASRLKLNKGVACYGSVVAEIVSVMVKNTARRASSVCLVTDCCNTEFFQGRTVTNNFTCLAPFPQSPENINILLSKLPDLRHFFLSG